MNSPFLYPATSLVRRHEPRGYTQASSYRPWLRDDFAFRCVFCLIREAWLPDQLEVEHYTPTACDPNRRLDYLNLLYACRTCNAKKGVQRVPDPCEVMIRDEISLGANGLLEGHSARAREMILVLGLNTRRQREYRRLMVGIIELAERHDRPLYHRLLGFPEDLPDLAALRPPRGNGKPDGIQQSCLALRQRGELPERY